ncbi:MAG TPA: hypothetical protein VHB21_19760 [Minicystis sp.]|nr:hypothetical protein [Minicystis sp.]
MANEDDAAKKGLENEGEGSRTAARRYDEATEKFIESGQVEDAAKEAEEALDGPEAEELAEAEAEGKRHAAVPPGSDQNEKEYPLGKKGPKAA